MNLAGLQTEQGPAGDRLIDLAQSSESHRYLRCQLMSTVYLSVQSTVGKQGCNIYVYCILYMLLS